MIITLANSEVQLVIRPDLGGRIDQLKDYKTGQEWLWHPPHYDAAQSRSLDVGASFDDHWTGGWDEIFPNDVGGQFRERELADHGELWSQAWQVVEQSATEVKLACQCQTVPVRVEKTIRIEGAEAQIHYQFQNQSDETIPFLLKQHAAIAIEAGDEILLPDCLVEPVTLDFSKIIGQDQKTRFPHAFAADGQKIELQRIPSATSQLQEFYYCSDLSVGECGIQKKESALLMRFDLNDFPYVWVFQSYGGWRDYYVLVMEPCTTIPFDLETACRNGTTAQLQPRETQQRTLTVQVKR